jgi:thiol:disulfide interchange protein
VPLPDAISSRKRLLFTIYYVCAFGLIVAGSILWATGHGTGDPYLTVGIALAILPPAVIWIRRFFGRG